MSGNLNITTTTFDAEIQSRLNAVDSNTPTQEMLKLYRASELFVGADYTVFSAELQSRLNAVTGSTESTELVKLAASFGKVSNDNEHGVPINGFMPLNVSDQAVYTAKSGSVWLRSGEELAYDPLIYPEAVPTVIEGYTGNNFSVSSQTTNPIDVLWVGNHFWVLSSDSQILYQYDSSGVYTGNHFSVSAQSLTPISITWDGVNFWVLDSTTTTVYEFTSAGVYTGNSAAIPLRSVGITWDGTYFWIIGDSGDTAYQYSNTWVPTGFFFQLNALGDLPFSGVTWDGSSLWITDDDNIGHKRAYQYTQEGVYTGVSLNFYSEDPDMKGITWDGSSLWMVGANTNSVFEYDTSGTKLGIPQYSDPVTGLLYYLRIK